LLAVFLLLISWNKSLPVILEKWEGFSVVFTSPVGGYHRHHGIMYNNQGKLIPESVRQLRYDEQAIDSTVI